MKKKLQDYLSNALKDGILTLKNTESTSYSASVTIGDENSYHIFLYCRAEKGKKTEISCYVYFADKLLREQDYPKTFAKVRRSIKQLERVLPNWDDDITNDDLFVLKDFFL